MSTYKRCRDLTPPTHKHCFILTHCELFGNLVRIICRNLFRFIFLFKRDNCFIAWFKRKPIRLSQLIKLLSSYANDISCAPCINLFWRVSTKCESTFISFQDDNALLVISTKLLVSCKNIIILYACSKSSCVGVI